MKKRILVTGGAGFIGSELLLQAINQETWEVHCIDKLTYAGTYEHVPAAVEFIKLDIVDSLDYVKEMKPDLIIHLAAESHVDNSIINPGEFVRTNVLGTQVLLNGARHTKAKFLHISTDEVYGSIPFSRSPAHPNSPLLPSSPYSASKAASDLLVEAYGTTFGLDYLITRSANNFGPRQHSEKALPTWIRAMLQGRPIPVYGDGTNRREWIYVKDNCQALIECALDLLHRGGYQSETGNIAESRYCSVFHLGGHEMSNIEMVVTLADIIGVDPKISFVGDRPGHDYRYSLKSDIEDLTPLREGLAKTVDYYRELWK